MSRATEAFAAIICTALPSTWVIVFARGLVEVADALDAAGLGPAKLFFRARLWPGATLVAESRRLRGRDDGIEVWCSFCW
jgi:hypothetical protein